MSVKPDITKEVNKLIASGATYNEMLLSLSKILKPKPLLKLVVNNHDNN